MKLSSVFILGTFVFSFVYCEDDRNDLSDGDGEFAFSKLPLDVQTDFIKILTGTANAIGGSCLGIEPDYSKVELLLYTNDTNNYTRLDPKNPVGIDYNEPLFLLTHGWVSGLNGYKIKAFRDKYIELYGKNIIFVNWGKMAWYPYTTVYCNIPFMAQHVATLLCDLNEKYNYPLSKVHMIGHSFGGQFSGHTGKAVQKTCNKKMGKITALDPAGPIYQFVSEANRVSPTDADFVEIVHSASGTFGYLGKAGTVDYHLNCGSLQPGCIIPKDITQIAQTSIFALCCPHMRAVEVWPYVLESREFKAKSCKLCPSIIPGTCVVDTFGANYISLGYAYDTPKSQHYNLITGPYAPFYLGCKAYPLQGCS